MRETSNVGRFHRVVSGSYKVAEHLKVLQHNEPFGSRPTNVGEPNYFLQEHLGNLQKGDGH